MRVDTANQLMTFVPPTNSDPASVSILSLDYEVRGLFSLNCFLAPFMLKPR